MTTGLPALRALVIYGLCLPLAVIIGCFLPDFGAGGTYYSYAVLSIFALILCAPLLFKWHHALAVLALNMTAVAFFVPGRPQIWMLLAGLSLGISVLQVTLLNRRMRFLSAPSVTLPLLFLLAVVFLTAYFTNGIGFYVFGGASIGGKRYITILAAVVAYFAFIARRIPPEKAHLYSGLFFLGGATAMLSSLVHVATPGLTFIFYMFPPEALPGESPFTDAAGNITRLSGLAVGSMAVLYFLLSRFGLRGILFAGKPWRLGALAACIILTLFGGFRSHLILIMLVLTFQAWLEGLFSSRLMPVVVMGGVLIAALTLSFASKLPLTVQRTLAFLPVKVDPAAQEAARVSTEWRVQIWREVRPEVDKHLLLGKGYAMSVEEWSQANASSSLENQGSTIVAGDYHNGPLSTIIPFGLWGVLGFLWLLWAGGRLLYCNFRYGNPALESLNAFLLAVFLAQVVLYVAVFGSLHSDLVKFTALFGLSIALNGGKCRPAPAPARQPVNIKFRAPLRPAPVLSR